MAEIIDGKLVSENIRLDLAKKIDEFKHEAGITPGLAVIIVGSNPASLVYVRNKKRACEQVGIKSYEIALPDDVIEDDLIGCIAELNANPEVHGILVQLPVPAHINEEKINKPRCFVYPVYSLACTRISTFYCYSKPCF